MRHSSLDYLRKMLVDIIKIDQSSIRENGEEKQDDKLVRTILDISKTMSIDLIAEGTEMIEQLNLLKNNQVDYVQGHYVYKPLKACEISDGLS
jgi:EAL domain-containing protein (putative c-di-GMP-specific phosphodiesterase class I)